jgi:hypothetical protein
MAEFKVLRLMLGIVLTLYGTTYLLWGWYYTEIGKNETTAMGVIRHAYPGSRGGSYEYSFQVGGTYLYDSDGQCETALSKGPCKAGTSVVVHYDRLNPSHNLLNGYGVESRQDLNLGKKTVAIGLFLLLWLYVQTRLEGNTQSHDELEHESPEEGAEILHVVPHSEA